VLSEYVIGFFRVCFMQHRIIYNKISGSGVFSLLMVMVTTVIADSNNSQVLPQTSPRLIAGQSNPWLPDQKQPDLQGSNTQQSNPWSVPARPGDHPAMQPLPEYRSQQRQRNQIDRQNQGFRFVTPAILESLKQQQRQTQMMQRNQQSYQPGPRQPVQGSYQRNYQQNYGYPSYGMGYSNPLYDVPAVSPWGSRPDILYRGQSFPLVPNEAIGGIPPIHIPSFGGNSYSGEPNSADTNNVDSNNSERRKENNVFNPFTFIPNGNLQ
jgi:hypothetical protein